MTKSNRAETGKIWMTIDEGGNFEWFDDKAQALTKRRSLREPIRENGDTGRILAHCSANTFEFDKAKLGPNDYKNPNLSMAKPIR